MRDYGYQDISLETAGLPWYKIWWKAIVPEGQAYEIIAADPGASVGKACLWVFLTSMVCNGIIILLMGALFGFMALPAISEFDKSTIENIGLISVTLACLLPIVFGLMGVVILLLMSGLSHAIAGLLGGTGTFTKLAYAFGAYMAPLMIVSTAITFIPVANYMGFLIGIYGLVLNIMAVKAVHQLDWGRSIASSAVIWVGLMGCMACVILVVLIIAGPSIGNVFSGAIDYLATPTPAW
ncbi:MAG: YIP1 family protein [Anaerolineae bacterium]|nr:YIP1 family protein [Anaerolineae bacterium]